MDTTPRKASQGDLNAAFPSAEHSSPKVGGVIQKYAIVPDHSTRVVAQRFCPLGEEGHRTETSESFPKGMDFIGNRKWRSSSLSLTLKKSGGCGKGQLVGE